jgi:protein SCO1/2
MFKLRVLRHPRDLMATAVFASLLTLNANAEIDHTHHHPVASSETPTDPHAHHKKMMESNAADPHAHHKMMMQKKTSYQKNTLAYSVPDLVLKNKNNERVNVNELLASDQPLIVSFIFTSCDTICPVLTATLSSAQDELLASKVPPKIVSVSIDPEEDTPARLRKYAASYDASDQWIFLTGTLDEIIRFQRALDVYRGSKLNHEPVTFVKTPGENHWLRLDGFTSAKALVTEYRNFIQ